jgi:hypothetical protein
MPESGRSLAITRVQAMAYHARENNKKVGAVNFLVKLCAKAPDSDQVIGLGEGQPRLGATGDRADVSWRVLEACLGRLHERELDVADADSAVAAVRDAMRELRPVADSFAAEVGWSDPFRGARVHEVLDSGRKLSMMDMMQLQQDELSIPARSLVPLLRVPAADAAGHPTAFALRAQAVRSRPWPGGGGSELSMSTMESLKKRRLAGMYPIAITVRATREEARRIERNARKAGRNRSRFLAELGAADGAAEKLPPPASPEYVAALEALMFQLRKAGVNLNQLAHRENSADVGGPLEPPSQDEVQEGARAVREVAEQIRATLR